MKALGTAAVAAATMLCGCPQAIRVEMQPDGSLARDGSSSPDGGPEGGPTGDAALLDGGAGPPPLTWTPMTLPQTVPLGNVGAIWGRSSSEVYAGAENQLLEFDGSTWSTVPWYTGDNDSIVGIWGAGSKLFVETTGSLFVRDTARAETSTYSAGFLRGLSGQSASEVYLVGWSQGCAEVREFDGMLKTLTMCSTLNYETTSIFTPSPGLAFIGGGGTEQMARFEMSTFTMESFQLPQGWIPSTRLQFLVNGIGQIAGNLFAVGSWHMIFEKTGPTTWTPVHSPAIDQANLGNEATLYALAGSGDEGYAVGTVGSGDGAILHYRSGTWTDAQYPGHAMLDTVWAASPELYFAGGYENSGGVILMGRR